ncbi:MAG: hypothetical protein ABSA05_14830 [Opitutaceae bacterium]
MRRLSEILAFVTCLAASASVGAAGGANATKEAPISSADSDIVVMRAFVVTATRLDKHPWRYASIPGYEILSNCDDTQTERYMLALLRGNGIDGAFSPKGGVISLTTPVTVILFSQIPEKDITAAVMSKLEYSHSDPVLWGRSLPSVSFPTSMAIDEDTEAYCHGMPSLSRLPGVSLPFGQSNQEGNFSGIPSFNMHSYRYLLEHRVPEFPAWLIEGLNGPTGIFTWPNMEAAEGRSVRFVIPAAQWVSDAETILARKRPESVTAILPLKSFFAQQNLRPKNRSPVWFSEAALFVRWGIFGGADGEQSSSAAFWSFVNKASVGPISERGFRECFGFGYAEMESRLREYLPKAVSGELVLKFDMDWNPSVPKLRDATASEIGRIIGDWQRMKGIELKAANPELSAEFLRVAGDTLLAPYIKGSRDPQLLAVLGLYEQSIGEEKRAREFLEAAASDHMARPTAYITLARICYGEAKAHPRGRDGKFNSDQVASVLNPLLSARRLSPALQETYLMITDTWAQSEVKPTPADFAVLDEGISFFWRNRRLVDGVAKLRTFWGYP